MLKSHLIITVFLAGALAAPSTSSAQIGGFIKRKAKERIEQKIVECLSTDLECIRKAKAEGKEVKVKEGSEGTVEAGGAGAAGGASASLKPGEGAWANYDFKPGDKILFTDDLTKDNVGDFPRRLEFVEGNAEVVEWNGGRHLRLTSDTRFEIPLAEPLPDRFTLEFDYAAAASGAVYVYLDKKGHPNDYLTAAAHGEGGIQMGARAAVTRIPGVSGAPGGLYKVRVTGDGKYVKVYLNEARVANVPNADLGRSNKIHFWADGDSDRPTLFTNFRVAAGGKPLYDALSEKGRVATQGIYFDSGSDKIRPESTPTLKEIAAMLKEHGDLKLTIEGHTDDVGNAQANHDLSHKRAAAVKATLVSSFGVDAARLESTGFGDKKPIAPNTTPEGRQQNRRVELAKS